MLKRILVTLAAVLCLSGAARAQYVKVNGVAEQSNVVVTSGINSTTKAPRTFPSATITIYDAGTVNLASIFTTSSGTAKANPFTADANARYDFFILPRSVYDVRISGTGVTTPFTISGNTAAGSSTGPVVSTDNAITRFNGTGGDIQNSIPLLDDLGNIDTVSGKTITLGNSTATDSARFIFRTQSSPVDIWHNSALTSNFTNGVTCGSTNYKDQTFNIGYNSNTAGVKINPSLVNFGLAFESKFCQSPTTAFQTEFYFTWTDPTGAINIRPWGVVVDHTTGAASWANHGDINYLRNVAGGNGQTALWHENGFMEFIGTASSTKIQLPNNTTIAGYNAANNAATPLIQRSAADKVSIDSGGVGTVFGADATATVFKSSELLYTAAPTTGIFFDLGGSTICQQVTGAIITCATPTTFEARKPIESVVTTGTAPLVIASTTPVANLTLTSHPQVLSTSGALQTSSKIVSGTGTLSSGTLVVTFTGAAVFGDTSYVCSGSNQTNANAFKIANTSASSITLTGTGTDVIAFHCIGQ